MNISHPSVIKSGATSNTFQSALKRTRTVINHIVKPHPTFEVPRSYTSPRRPLVMHPVAKIPPMSSENYWETVNVSIPESNDFNDESGPLDAPSVPHISSLDVQHHRDYGGVIGTAGQVTTLRRVKGNIRSMKRGHKATISLSLSQHKPNHVVESRTRSPPPKLVPKRLTPILEQDDPPELDSDILSQSDSIDSGLENSAESVIHFVDEASGATFSRVQHASGACISAEQFMLERVSLNSSLSLHIDSPPACAAADLDRHIESLPSLVLTIPTPASPNSPIFSPGVHFTTEKFLDAAEAAAPRDRVPTLPQCDHGQEGKLCRACELQLLACRVWFQNADGGARAALHEPFVRPAQSTVRTRAVLASLGVGTPCPSGVGLGLADVQGEGEGEGETFRDEDDEDNIDDPGSLAIEAPPVARPRLVSLGRAISWSRVVLGKLRLRLRTQRLSMSNTQGSNKLRKHRHS